MGFLLDGPLRAYRIADGRFPILNGTGAAKFGGRWNTAGVSVVYAAQTYEGALLELRVHTGPDIPRNQVYAEISIPAGSQIWQIEPADLPQDWIKNEEATRRVGDEWIHSARCVALSVPSAVTGDFLAWNILINPLHSDFFRVTASAPQRLYVDPRLYRDS